MLTKISLTTGAVTAILNAVVLLGWWDLSTDQIAGISVALLAIGGAVHSWFNPNIPVGKT